MDVHGFHLPAGTADDVQLQAVSERDGVRVLVPALTAAHVGRICEALLLAHARLRTLEHERIIGAIDAAARRLRDEPERRRVVAALAAITGYSATMAEAILERMSEDWLAPALHRLVRSELGDPAVLERFVPGADARRRVHAIAPRLGLHVFSGNVPGVSVTSMVRALLVRSAVLGKSAAAEPILAPFFARLLAVADPDVGAAVAVTWWRGGSDELEQAALRHAGLVVHYGGADAIASLRERAAAHTRFIEHGPRISFALVDGASDQLLRAAADTADAVAMFDQQGCVSPQLAYVIGGRDAAGEFAAAVAARLRELAASLPRGALLPGEAASVRELRTRAEFRAIAGEDVELFADAALGWTVIRDPDPRFEGSCLNRTLIVKSVPDLEALIREVRPFGRLLQTAGVAAFPQDELESLAATLADIGVTRVAPIGAMPWPPVDWHHDGRGPLRELVRWVDLEAG